MADEDGALTPERADETGGVGGERAPVVRAALLGAPVAPQVRGERAVAGGRERRQLVPPGARELRKAVEKQDEWAVRRSGGECVEPDPVGTEVELLDPGGAQGMLRYSVAPLTKSPGRAPPAIA